MLDVPTNPPPAVKPAVALVDPTAPKIRVTVHLAATCVAPGARAMVLERRLKKLGQVLEMIPTPAQLSGGRITGPLRALVATHAQRDALRAACLAVPEVEAAEADLPDVTPVFRDMPAPERRADATVRVRADALDQVL